MKNILTFLQIFFCFLIIWIFITGGDTFYPGKVQIKMHSLQNPIIFLCILIFLKELIYADNSILKKTHKYYYYSLTGLLFYILTVITTKSIVILLAIYRLHHPFSWKDIPFTFGADLSLAFGGIISLIILRKILENKKTPAKLKKICIYATGLIAIFSSATAVFYGFTGYVYFEWSSYIESQHLEAMRKAGVGSEAIDLFFRWPTVIVIAVLFCLWWAAWFLTRLNSTTPSRPLYILSIILAPFLFFVKSPIIHPEKFPPVVQSPIVMLIKPKKNSNGIDVARYLKKFRNSTGKDYQPFSGSKTIHNRYRNLAGIAKGKNVIFFVMESVRQQNLDLYGYKRCTMPTLKKFAEHAIVFEQGYVTQPRSSKAYTAIALGETPDPRLTPISWDSCRVKGKDTLFNRLIDDGRRYYIGTTQPWGSDSMETFFNAVSNKRAKRIVSFETLRKTASIPNNDLGLSLDFLNWTQQSRRPFVGILWTQCAHMPYNAPTTPFGTKHLIDKYDNCLKTVDSALEKLINGLKQQKKLNQTLFVIFGDHGEALGEKFDRGHGNYLYEHSLKVPVIIANPDLFKTRISVSARFQLKDIPATILYLLDLPSTLNQSVNIFSKDTLDPLYFSNVYQDFKLGFLKNNLKFIYRPTYDLVSIYDLNNDPEEKINIATRFGRENINDMKKETLLWYKFHTNYLDHKYPLKKK